MKKYFALLLVLALAGGALAQTSANHDVTVALSAFNIIRVNAGTAITLTIDTDAVTDPGDKPGTVTNDAHYLQYTVLAASNRKITAALSANMPAGVTLKVVAGAPSGGAGTPGTAQGEVTLSTTAGDLIDGISSCYTGTGATDGAQLTYTAESDGTVTAQNIARTVTYTFAAGT